MTDWIDVAAPEDIAPGTARVVDVDGVMVAVINLDGEFYAIEDVCTHDGGELASGCIEGEEIVCPRHGARFNIKTGAVTAPPAYEDVDTLPVRVEGGVVQVRDDRWD
jgi:3-phenylpropionate/trans-cinnamate dioxygenase ferredoxin subunit